MSTYNAGDRATKYLLGGAHCGKIFDFPFSHASITVSYTHLTLPTIYSV